MSDDDIEFRLWSDIEDAWDRIIEKYFDGDEWAPLHEWDTDDVVDLEILANGELQRREAQGEAVEYIQ